MTDTDTSAEAVKRECQNIHDAVNRNMIPAYRLTWVDLLRGLAAERDAAMREALSLAHILHKNHYSDVTQWVPLDDPAGVITQIDNMVAGIVSERDALLAERDKLEAENARLREALTWYRDNVLWCNNFGHEGTEARDRLAKDIGQRADAALQEGGEAEEPFSEYGHYGENNPPVGMSSPSDKDYEV